MADILEQLKARILVAHGGPKDMRRYGWNLTESDSLMHLHAAIEIERLRDGLTAITCESINAEAMAQNVLDGLPPYHGMGMMKPNASFSRGPSGPSAGSDS